MPRKGNQNSLVNSIVPTEKTWGEITRCSLEQQLSFIGGGDMLERWFGAMGKGVMKWELCHPITFRLEGLRPIQLRFIAWGYYEPTSDLAVGRVHLFPLQGSISPLPWRFRLGGWAAELMSSLYRISEADRFGDPQDIRLINVVWLELLELAEAWSEKAVRKAEDSNSYGRIASDIELA